MTRAMDRARALLNNTNLPPVSAAPTTRGIMARLKSIRDDQGAAIDIDPARVRVWHLQGRLQDDLSAASVADIIESIRLHGQAVPAIVRPLDGDPDADYEVIDGSRRRFACQTLGRPLKAVVSELSDLQAAVLTETADTARKHSVYETGLKWQAWLREGLFATHDKLAEFVGGSQGDVSFKLALAEVPPAFVRSIGGHERVSRELGRRLSKLVVRARQLDRLESLKDQLLSVAAADDSALDALNAIESAFQGARKAAVGKPHVLLLSNRVGQHAVQLSKPDRATLALKFLKGASATDREAYALALETFTREWWGERASLAANKSDK